MTVTDTNGCVPPQLLLLLLSLLSYCYYGRSYQCTLQWWQELFCYWYMW